MKLFCDLVHSLSNMETCEAFIFLFYMDTKAHVYVHPTSQYP